MSTELGSPELTREGIRVLVEELGMARAMRFLGDWSQRNREPEQSRSEYLPERDRQFGTLNVDEICREIERWKSERSQPRSDQPRMPDTLADE